MNLERKERHDHPEFLRIKGSVSCLLSEIYYADHARNVDAIEKRKQVHLLFIEKRVSYRDAFAIMRELIPSNEEFHAVMRRVRETCLAVLEGRESHALRMVDEYYEESR